MATLTGSSQLQTTTASPRPIPRYTPAGEMQRPTSPYSQSPSLNAGKPNTDPRKYPRGGSTGYGFRAFTPNSSGSLSRSPSVASWRSYETDYDDGLVIEEIDSDDEGSNNSDVEILIGEYEDAPSDDEGRAPWKYQKYNKSFEQSKDSLIYAFEELSTSPMYLKFERTRKSPLASPCSSVRSSKRSFSDSDAGEDTDRDSQCGEPTRKLRRRIIAASRAPITTATSLNSAKSSQPTKVIRGFHISSLHDPSEMEE